MGTGREIRGTWDSVREKEEQRAEGAERDKNSEKDDGGGNFSFFH